VLLLGKFPKINSQAYFPWIVVIHPLLNYSFAQTNLQLLNQMGQESFAVGSVKTREKGG
jgi:hypothetical protein